MIEYKLIRMKRKTVSLSIDDDLNIIVKAPIFARNDFIDRFVSEHEKWILNALEKKKASNAVWSEENLLKLKNKADIYLHKRVEHFSHLTGFIPVSVGVTKAKTRFGSCSGKNRINFSIYLFAYPDEVIDYVILHELCHIKYKNHSKDFYNEIAKFMPDYKSRDNMLKKPPSDVKNS